MGKVDQLRALRENLIHRRPGISAVSKPDGRSIAKRRADTPSIAVFAATIAENAQAADIKPQPLRKAKPDVTDAMKSRLRRLGLTLAEFSTLTGTPKRTVEEWSRHDNTPGWVDVTLLILERSADALTILRTCHQPKD